MAYKNEPCARGRDHKGGCSSAKALKNRRERERRRYGAGRQYQRGALTRTERRMFIGLLKLAYGCTDCGYRGHPEALQFDHLPEFIKSGEINKMVKYNPVKLFTEIAKCEVVCANCHAIRSAVRRSAQLGLILTSTDEDVCPEKS